MKAFTLILIITILSITTVISQDVDQNNIHQIGYGTQYFRYPRIPASCPKAGDAQQFGFFWDSQKCEVCQEYCKCTEYLGCDTCMDGYGKLFVPHTNEDSSLNKAVCKSCGGESILDCCFQVVEKHSQVITSVGDSKYRKYHNFVTTSAKAMRAVKCNVGLGKTVSADGKTTTYTTNILQAGSVCHHISHCKDYAPYGVCTTCMSGYFLDSDMTCQRCGHGYSGSVTSHCIKCNGPSDCQQCQEGYYLPTYHYQFANNKNHLTQLDRNASLCVPCNNNCICTETNLCSNCRKTEGFVYSSEQKECKQCKVGCLTCRFDDAVCTKCAVGYQLIGGECKACDQTCHSEKCIQFTEGTGQKVGCAPDGCINGYVYSTLTKKCVRCSQDGIISRCELNPNQDPTKAPVDMIPTQCHQQVVQEAFEHRQNDQWTQIFDRLPVHGGNGGESYFLITQGGKRICQPNKTLKCKTMLDNVAADKQVTCKECYTDFGYHKLSTGGCIQCSLDYCLSHTLKTDKCACNACVTNQNQTQDFRQGASAGGVNTLLNYVVGGTDLCEACPAGCLNCDVSKQCNECQLGYANIEKKCTVCTPLNCKTCEGKVEICSACFDGYRLWTSSEVVAGDAVATNTPRCEKCDPGCKSCQSDVKKCTSCMSGYHLLDNICRKNRYHCDKHNDDGSCLHCKYGYRNVQGMCVLCEHSTTAKQGYFNCPNGCSATNRYVRDGDLLTESYQKQRTDQKYTGLNSQIISFAATICVVLLATLI